MKVIILNNYGGRIPHEIIPFVAGDKAWRWGKAINHIEYVAVPANSPDAETAKVVQYPGTEPNSKTYLFKSENIILSIVEVDTSRNWTIQKYDGAEYVQYLDYTVINEAYGYCELPTK